jgi:hypothetical protein
MNTEILETVLNEVLDEQRQSTQALKDLQKFALDLQVNLIALGETVQKFEQGLATQKVIAPPADTAPLQEVVAAGMESSRQEIAQSMERIGAIVEAQPKAVTRQYRIMFFPETDRAGHYKYLIGKLCLAVILVVLLGVVLSLGSLYIDKTHLPYASPEPHALSNFAVPPEPAPTLRLHGQTPSFPRHPRHSTDTVPSTPTLDPSTP